MMLSRAMLPLTRPNILAPAVRASTLSVPHARWYAKNNKPKKTPYKVPESVKSKSTKPEKPEQPANAPREQYSTEQAEFDTKADPRENSTVNTSVPVKSTQQWEGGKLCTNFNLTDKYVRTACI